MQLIVHVLTPLLFRKESSRKTFIKTVGVEVAELVRTAVCVGGLKLNKHVTSQLILSLKKQHTAKNPQHLKQKFEKN